MDVVCVGAGRVRGSRLLLYVMWAGRGFVMDLDMVMPFAAEGEAHTLVRTRPYCCLWVTRRETTTRVVMSCVVVS